MVEDELGHLCGLARASFCADDDKILLLQVLKEFLLEACDGEVIARVAIAQVFHLPAAREFVSQSNAFRVPHEFLQVPRVALLRFF